MSHFLADDGAKIHVQVSGEGSPIVMLHGWTSSNQEWFPFLNSLNQRHRIFRWDARGHGQDNIGDRENSHVKRMAHDLQNLLDHFELEKVTAVGHSMGALTLWQYIRDFGCDRLSKICLIDQSPKLLTDDEWEHGIYGDFDAAKSAEFLNTLRENFAEGVLKLTAFGLNSRAREKYLANASAWEKSRAALQRQNPAPLVRCWESLTEADYRDVLGQISVPSMLVYGGESNFYRVATAHYVARQIPKSILHIYPGTDHSPHQWQRERFTRELMEFIDTPA